MEIWQIKSNPNKQRLLNAFLIAIGGLLIFGFSSQVDFSHFTNGTGGFLLGLLIFILGLVSIIVSYNEIITIDPNKKQITIVRVSRLGTKTLPILFSDIERVGIGFIGRASNIVLQNYYVNLHLKDGSNCPLFFPAYYDGRGDESVAQDRKAKIEQYLNLSN